MKGRLKYWVLGIINGIRKNFLLTFMPYRYRNKLALRRGKCCQCAMCCIIPKCKLLTKNNLCSVYKDRPHPSACNPDFPIDRFEQIAMGVIKTCSYYFVKE